GYTPGASREDRWFRFSFSCCSGGGKVAGFVDLSVGRDPPPPPPPVCSILPGLGWYRHVPLPAASAPLLLNPSARDVCVWVGVGTYAGMPQDRVSLVLDLGGLVSWQPRLLLQIWGVVSRRIELFLRRL
ncbi:unnamed protein product, partial [Ectocarpus sp. 12 AP-2014]